MSPEPAIQLTAPELDELLSGVLHQRGQRVTSQRLLVHRIVRQRGTHLSAEQVYGYVRRELPATSLPTIYATLELLDQLGLVRRLSLGGPSVLYDGRIDPHGHAICRECGAVSDIEQGELQPALRAAAHAGFRAEHADAVVSGYCQNCC